VPIPEKIDRLDGMFYMNAQWKLCRVWWPQRCEITGKRLWPGTLAYRGQSSYKAYVTDPWSREKQTITETRWHGKVEHLIWQLKE